MRDETFSGDRSLYKTVLWLYRGKANILAKAVIGDLFFYAGNGKGGFTGKLTRNGQGWTNVDLYPAGDLNGDGLADLYSRDSANRLWFYAGKPGGFRTAVQVGSGW